MKGPKNEDRECSPRHRRTPFLYLAHTMPRCPAWWVERPFNCTWTRSAASLNPPRGKRPACSTSSACSPSWATACLSSSTCSRQAPSMRAAAAGRRGGPGRGTPQQPGARGHPHLRGGHARCRADAGGQPAGFRIYAASNIVHLVATACAILLWLMTVYLSFIAVLLFIYCAIPLLFLLYFRRNAAWLR
jgi:hypothetical protein